MRRRIAVVGASLAGLRTVEALRRQEVDADITLIGDETELPYDRPPLSKGILLGKLEPNGIRLTTDDRLAGLQLDLRLGTRATRLDLDRRRLELDTTGPGSGTSASDTVEFDELVIATGSSARTLPTIPDLPGIHVLRTLADAKAIRAALGSSPRVAVLGGGFIGAEVASSARTLGLEVTVVDVAPVLMERGLGAVVGGRMTELARERGVTLRLGVGVSEVLGSDRFEGLRLADGSTVEAEVLVLGIGARPNDEWLQGSGLEVADGVLCDEFLSAAPGVYAIGDVARFPHPLYSGTIRCEHWTAAGEHADAVATTLAGTPTAAATVPYVWTDQHGIKLQAAGVLQPEDEIRFVIDEPGKFLAVTGASGTQHAAFGLNAAGPLIRQRMKMAGHAPWPPA